jgi:hypothetical protein
MYNTYPQPHNYGPQHDGYGYAPMQQPMHQMQQMPMQAAPVAQSAAASKGLLMVAGLAVVGAAAFGGVFLMNSSSQPEQTAASAPSTVFNIPSEINIPGLNTNSDPASPVVVNKPAPRVFTPSAPRSTGSSASVVSAPATGPVQNPAPQNPAPQKPVEEPKKEEPKKEEPKKEEPKKEEPKKEEPKKEEPKKEEPKKEEPNPGGGFPGGDPIDYGGCVCG